MSERLNIPVKSRNSADEDYHCFSGRIETDVDYVSNKKNSYGQIVPFVSFRLISNANPKSMKPTAHYECRAWNKCAERMHVLGLTKGYGLVCWAKFRTKSIRHEAKGDKPAVDIEYSWFEIQRFVIKSLPKEEREALIAEQEEDDGDAE